MAPPWAGNSNALAWPARRVEEWESLISRLVADQASTAQSWRLCVGGPDLRRVVLGEADVRVRTLSVVGDRQLRDTFRAHAP